RTIRPGLKLSAAVVPDIRRARLSTLQNWKHWLDNQFVDFLNNMAYTANLWELEEHTGQMVKLSEGRSLLYAGLGVWLNDPEQLMEQIALVREQGLPGVTLFASVHLTEEKIEALTNGPFRERALLPHRDPVEAAAAVLGDLPRKVALYRELGALDDGAVTAAAREAEQLRKQVLKAREDGQDKGDGTALDGAISALEDWKARAEAKAGEGSETAQRAWRRIAQDVGYVALLLRSHRFLTQPAEYRPPEEPPLEAPAVARPKQGEAAATQPAAAGTATNLALASRGTRVTVDSNFPGYGPRPLNDGERNDTSEEGRWAEVAWASGEIPGEHWIVLEFPEPVEATRVDIYWARDRGKFWSSQTYVIEYQPPGSERWVELYRHQDPEWRTQITAHSIQFQPVNMAKLRIRQPEGGGPARRPNLMWVAEVEVY
ncbi:MAG: discoidin domain-containing protein, partial [Bacillota bacterium]